MDKIIATTTYGKVEGITVRVGRRDVLNFHRIPFAKPPLNELRFMPPQPVENWKGILDGKIQGPMPWQNMAFYKRVEHFFPYKAGLNRTESNMNEDCLQCSVYTTTTENTANLPVLVWFYGGSFTMGSSLIFDGSVLSGLNDVVVVVPNYRLGVFGFLSLGPNSQCSGNAGLLDQIMCLRWVNNNIAAFGGNPNNVTIFGSSAGGMSVGYHINSPLSRGLFHKAISCSGCAKIPMQSLFENNWKSKFTSLCELMDCDPNNPEKSLKYLQKVSAKTLSGAAILLSQRQLRFMPIYDGNFFINKLDNFYEKSSTMKSNAEVPYIIGYNNHDGASVFTTQVQENSENDILKSGCRELKMYFPILKPNTVMNQLKEYYMPKTKVSSKYRYDQFRAIRQTDMYFKLPAITTAIEHSNSGAPTYVYEASYRFKYNHDEKYGPNNGKKPEWVECDHMDDVFMTFGVPLSSYPLAIAGTRFTEQEKLLSRDIMTYFSNFAKTGNPNSSGQITVEWPKYWPTEGKCIQFRTDGLQIANELMEKEYLMWKRFHMFNSKYSNKL